MNDYKTLKEHVDKLGAEYRTQMEIYKKQQFAETLIDLCNFFNITKEVREAENNNEKIINVFDAFFSIGYYKGLEYGLNHNAETENISDIDLLTKHQDLLAEEYNK